VIYLRRNHVQESVGEFYDVSQSTISLVIGLLTPWCVPVLGREANRTRLRADLLLDEVKVSAFHTSAGRVFDP